MDEEEMEDNHRWWDERAALHAGSAFYDLDGFRRGHSSLREYEAEELGPVRGLSLLHLQCHLGNDTLSWARLGAEVTGLDFSAPALEIARDLAREIGVEAEFVEATVAGAAAALNRRFDVVYTGCGALTWLPSIREWAAVVAQLVRPGGVLYLVEFHPVCDAMADLEPRLAYDYEEGTRVLESVPGDYAVPEAATTHNRSAAWIHPLGDQVEALTRAGFRIELLRERSETYFPRFPELVPLVPGVWVPAPGEPRLPLTYSLRARREGRGRRGAGRELESG